MKDNKEETFMQTVYVLNGVTYVPHYRNPSVFVGQAIRASHASVTQTLIYATQVRSKGASRCGSAATMAL